jgi:hypothetical protein
VETAMLAGIRHNNGITEAAFDPSKHTYIDLWTSARFADMIESNTRLSAHNRRVVLNTAKQHLAQAIYCRKLDLCTAAKDLERGHSTRATLAQPADAVAAFDLLRGSGFPFAPEHVKILEALEQAHQRVEQARHHCRPESPPMISSVSMCLSYPVHCALTARRL